MHRNSVLPVLSLLLIASAYFLRDPDVAIAAPESRALGGAYLGFDLNTYPGDAALPVLRKTFSFAGYWLSPPPGAKRNTWVGKRQLLWPPHLLRLRFPCCRLATKISVRWFAGRDRGGENQISARAEAGVCRPRCFAWLLVEG